MIKMKKFKHKQIKNILLLTLILLSFLLSPVALNFVSQNANISKINEDKNENRFQNDPISIKPPKTSSTEWNLEGWNYRNEILISPATPENDYQVRVTLNPSNIDYSKIKSNL